MNNITSVLKESKEVNLHNTTDARIWASEFCKRYPKIDEDIMLGWFANAIMCGYDHANWKRDKEEQITKEVNKYGHTS